MGYLQAQKRVTEIRFLIGIATYNERENLPLLIQRIRDRYPTVDVLVVDDNSPDGTGSWCRDQARHDRQLKWIPRPRKSGLGSAVRQIFRYAIDQSYDWLITMDADLSHDPAQLDRLLDATSGADVVIGSRYVAGGVIRNWPWRRRWASRLTNQLVRVLLSLPWYDCSSGYRAYRVGMLSSLDEAPWVSGGYAFYEEVLWRLRKAGARITEVPITFVDRRAGKSKAGLGQSLRAVAELFLLWARG